MAMLAEPRRRQKIGPNPRGKFFLEDDDNKGRLMLQKMGWAAGDGLGVKRQGDKLPIHLKVQNDARGLGFTPNTDPWIAHTEEFAQLLQNLEPIKPGKDPEVEEPAEESPLEKAGLEKKSKASRTRIHYHKFVKSKDVSAFSSKDLSCIFGKPADALGSGSNSNIGENDAQDKDVVSREENEQQYLGFGFGGTTGSRGHVNEEVEENNSKEINKGSMKDYFAMKLHSGKVKQKDHSLEQDVANCNDVVGKDCVDYHDRPEQSEEAQTMEPGEPEKKKKRKKKLRDQSPDHDAISVQPQTGETFDSCEPEKKKRKKKNIEDNPPCDTSFAPFQTEKAVEVVKSEEKKRKTKSSEDTPPHEANLTSVEAVDGSELERKKQKKKSKKYSRERDNADAQCQSSNSMDTNVSEEKHKKKVKAESSICNGDSVQDYNSVDLIEGNPSKKKKRKKVREDEYHVQATEPKELVDGESTESDLVKKKKHKKKVKEESLSRHCIASEFENNVSGSAGQPEKKRKKKIRKDSLLRLNYSEHDDTSAQTQNEVAVEVKEKKKRKKKSKEEILDQDNQPTQCNNEAVEANDPPGTKQKKVKKESSFESDDDVKPFQEEKCHTALGESITNEEIVVPNESIKSENSEKLKPGVAFANGSYTFQPSRKSRPTPHSNNSAGVVWKHRKRRIYLNANELVEVGQNFAGANLNELNGYPHY